MKKLTLSPQGEWLNTLFTKQIIHGSVKELTYSPGGEFRKHSKEYPKTIIWMMNIITFCNFIIITIIIIIFQWYDNYYSFLLLSYVFFYESLVKGR